MSHLLNNFNTPLSHNGKMLHFDANPIKLDIWVQSYEEFATVFANISDLQLIPFDHVTCIKYM